MQLMLLMSLINKAFVYNVTLGIIGPQNNMKFSCVIFTHEKCMVDDTPNKEQLIQNTKM